MKKTTMILATTFIIGGAAVGFAAQDATKSTQAIAEEPLISLATGEANTPSEATTNGISRQEAERIALAVLDGKVEEVERDRENGREIWEVEIEYNGEDYDFDIDVETGDVLKIDGDLRRTPIVDEMNVTAEEAIAIVQEQFPTKKVDDVELEKKRGVYVYEVELDGRDDDGDVYVDGMTGEIVHVDDDLLHLMGTTNESNEGQRNANATTDSTSDGISAQEAGQIALNHIGSGKIDDIDRERKNGTLVYEVEVEGIQGQEDDDADVYVDATTGEVLYVDFD